MKNLQTHRLAIFAALVAIVISVIFHSPWSGYITELPAAYITPMELESYCPGFMTGISKLEDTREQFTKKWDELNECEERYKPKPTELELQEWRSKFPVIQWFGYIVNLVVTITAIGFLLVAWLFLENFQNNTEKQD